MSKTASERSKLAEERATLYRDLLSFHNMYYGMNDTVTNWTECAETMSKLSAHYRDSPFVMRMLSAIYEDIEDETKENRRV